MLLNAILKFLKVVSRRPDYIARGCDPLGCGHYLASRGSRIHEGEDVRTVPGEMFVSPFDGEIVRLGWAYRKDPRYRIIDIRVTKTMICRVYYVDPTVKVGDKIKAGDVIGVCQDITEKHGRKMINHAHLQVEINGQHVDPKQYITIKEF